MKYEEKTFSVPLGGKAFGDNYEVAFLGRCASETHLHGCCNECGSCGMRVRKEAQASHDKRCRWQALK